MKKLILLIGNESTGTRIINNILIQHSQIHNYKAEAPYKDCLDPVWKEIEKGKIERARSLFDDYNEEILLTRRSMPHSLSQTEPAKYMDFIKLDEFYEATKSRKIFVLITVRSAYPCLLSASMKRASNGHSYNRAIAQYQVHYKKLFQWIVKNNLEFYFVPTESLQADGDEFLPNICRVLDLPVQTAEFEKKNPNKINLKTKLKNYVKQVIK